MLWTSVSSLYFNSRPCERGDKQPRSGCPVWRYFNSRPCERGDEVGRGPPGGRRNFNSRPCERGDARSGVATGHRGISIHAPARGATPCGAYPSLDTLEFQFTPLREGRPATVAELKASPFLFQFTPLREGRPRPAR